jgi:MFS family permease
MSKASPLGALSERGFRIQFTAQAASILGDNVAPLAVAFAVLDLTGSAADLGIVLAAHSVPLVIFLLAGGIWADRVARKRIMVISDLIRFGTQAAFAALLLSHHAWLWELVLLQVIRGTATAFFKPASVGLTPQNVSPHRLQQANALLSLTTSSASIVGPSLSGLLVATVGPGWAIALDSVTFALSATLLSQLRLPSGGIRLLGNGSLGSFSKAGMRFDQGHGRSQAS